MVTWIQHRGVLPRRHCLVLVAAGVLGAIGFAAVAFADGGLPGYVVREVDRVAYRRPHAPTRPTSAHAIGGTKSGTDGMFPRVTLQQAQARLPFHVLVPAALPPGFALTAVQMPPGKTDPPYVSLLYRAPGAPPTIEQTLSILEEGVGFSTGLAPRNQPAGMVVLRGTSEEAIVNGKPAVYLKALTVQGPDDVTARKDNAGNALLMERSGVVVHLSTCP